MERYSAFERALKRKTEVEIKVQITENNDSYILTYALLNENGENIQQRECCSSLEEASKRKMEIECEVRINKGRKVYTVIYPSINSNGVKKEDRKRCSTLEEATRIKAEVDAMLSKRMISQNITNSGN